MNPVTELFLFVDALGWETVRDFHFMETLLPERRSVEMQFGYSCSAIPTILSGKTPAEHGHLGFFRFAPEDSPFKHLARFGRVFFHPESFWNRGRVRNLLSSAVGRICGFSGYFRLYRMPMSKIGMMDYCEKQDLFRPGGMAPIENLADVLAHVPLSSHISDWRRSDGENFRAGRDEIFRGTEFIFLYTAELDGVLHEHCRNRGVVEEKLRWYEEQIRGLFRAAELAGRTLHVTVFSDHGMTPFAGTVDILSAMERSGLVFGRDYGACCDSTMFRVYWLRPGVEELIRAALEPFAGLGRWLSESDERRYGIYREDRGFGDEIFLMNPGVQIVPSDLTEKPLNGMHGFAPEDRFSKAAILSSAPIPDFVRSVSDYFPLMRRRIAELEVLS